MNKTGSNLKDNSPNKDEDVLIYHLCVQEETRKEKGGGRGEERELESSVG